MSIFIDRVRESGEGRMESGGEVSVSKLNLWLRSGEKVLRRRMKSKENRYEYNIGTD